MVHDQRARVGGGDEERDHQQDAGERRHLGERERLEHVEQRGRNVVVDRRSDVAHAVQLQLQRGAAEDGHPQEAEQRRDDHDAEDQLTDGAALGDAGDEHADERRPRDPPAPVEDGPAALPLGAGEGLVPERELGQCVDVEPEALHERGHDEQRRADGEQEDQEQAGQCHVDLAEALDAAVQTSHDRHGRHAGDHRDQQDLESRAVGPAEQVVEARCGLADAKAERSRETEQGREHGQDVDRVAPRPVDLLTEQRVEHRAERQRQPAVVGEERQRQRDQRVDRPRVHAPVEEGRRERCLAGLGRAGLDPEEGSGVAEVEDRLRDRPEHQADAHAGAEQHRVPGGAAELGLGGWTADADLAGAAEREVRRREHEQVRSEDVEPAEARVDAFEDAVEDPFGPVGERQRQPDEREQQAGGPERDLRMQVEAPLGDVGVTGLPVGDLGIEVDVGIDLQAFDAGTLVDRGALLEASSELSSLQLLLGLGEVP